MNRKIFEMRRKEFETWLEKSLVSNEFTQAWDLIRLTGTSVGFLTFDGMAKLAPPLREGQRNMGLYNPETHEIILPLGVSLMLQQRDVHERWDAEDEAAYGLVHNMGLEDTEENIRIYCSLIALHELGHSEDRGYLMNPHSDLQAERLAWDHVLTFIEYLYPDHEKKDMMIYMVECWYDQLPLLYEE